MELESGLGTPPVLISLVQENIAIVPETVNGVLTVSQKSPFIRGDVDYDGVFNALADGLYLLNYGFTNGPAPPCLDAADANDSGDLNTLTDALLLLEHGFLGGPPPPPPYPTAGTDPTTDSLDCVP